MKNIILSVLLLANVNQLIAERINISQPSTCNSTLNINSAVGLLDSGEVVQGCHLATNSHQVYISSLTGTHRDTGININESLGSAMELNTFDFSESECFVYKNQSNQIEKLVGGTTTVIGSFDSNDNLFINRQCDVAIVNGSDNQNFNVRFITSSNQETTQSYNVANFFQSGCANPTMLADSGRVIFERCFDPFNQTKLEQAVCNIDGNCKGMPNGLQASIGTVYGEIPNRGISIGQGTILNYAKERPNGNFVKKVMKVGNTGIRDTYENVEEIIIIPNGRIIVAFTDNDTSPTTKDFYTWKKIRKRPKSLNTKLNQNLAGLSIFSKSIISANSNSILLNVLNNEFETKYYVLTGIY